MVANPSDEIPVIDRLGELLARAEYGDETVLSPLKELLDRHPEVWEIASDVGKQAEEAQVSVYAGSNLLLRESIQRRLQALKDELSNPGQWPLESLIIERVAITWLQAADADRQLTTATDTTARMARFLEKRAERAHRRHLAACRELATVRKLLQETVAISAAMYGDQANQTNG